MADTIDPFAKILSSAEFALTALLRKAHELYGITSDACDLFEAFTVDALRRCAPSLLPAISMNLSESVSPINPLLSLANSVHPKNKDSVNHKLKKFCRLRFRR
jgi:hypothetical protein